MNEDTDLIPNLGDLSVQEQLVRAARDLWSMVVESGDDFVVFVDRRRLHTRVQRESDGTFAVLWENEVEEWVLHSKTFKNLREAAFHAYQGPH